MNTRPEALTFDYYSVASLAGALDSDGWNSLDEQNVDAIGGSPGQSWDLLGPGSEHEVSEGFLQGASTLAAGASLDLGKLFDPSVFGKRNDGDLTFEFALQGNDLVTGIVNYITPPPLLGDYNDNGVVDAADYAVWRDNLGASITLPNEAVTPGVVNQADYDEWKARFGDAIGGGSLAATGSCARAGRGIFVSRRVCGHFRLVHSSTEVDQAILGAATYGRETIHVEIDLSGLICGPCIFSSMAEAAEPAASLAIDVDAVGTPVPPTLHGLFFEDINYGADGGLYAELIQNRSFEHGESLYGWRADRRQRAAANSKWRMTSR